MKSLDIVSGNIVLDDCCNHQVKIEYTGGIQRGRLQERTHTVTVAYSSFSKKLQSIQRLGGKIINVSIFRFQVDLAEVDAKDSDADRINHQIVLIPEKMAEIDKTHEQTIEVAVAVETIDHGDHDDITSPAMAVIIAENIVENVPEIISEIISEETLEITDQPETVDFEIITETIAEPEVIAEPEPILEIVSEKIDVISETTAAVEDATAVNPEKSQSSSAIASKPKKSRTSTKASHGFSKWDTKSQTQVSEIIVEPVEPVAKIADEILQVAKETVMEPNIDLPIPQIVEVIPEPVLEESLNEVIIAEPIISEMVTEEIAAPIPESSSTPKSLAKSKKSKAANKSGHGFNKSKGDR